MRKLGRSTKFFHFSKRELRNLSFSLSVERVFANFLDGQLISARARRGRYRRTWMEEGEKGQARNARAFPTSSSTFVHPGDDLSVEKASTRGVLFQFQRVNWNCLPQTPRAACLSTASSPVSPPVIRTPFDLVLVELTPVCFLHTTKRRLQRN